MNGSVGAIPCGCPFSRSQLPVGNAFQQRSALPVNSRRGASGKAFPNGVWERETRLDKDKLMLL